MIIQWINELIKDKGNEKKSETKQQDKEEKKIKIVPGSNQTYYHHCLEYQYC